MEENEEIIRVWRRDIAFTVFRFIEIILCFILYCYFLAAYSSQITEATPNLSVSIFRGYILSVYLILCNILVRHFSVPRHLINPLEAVISLWLWLTYVSITMNLMSQIRVGVQESNNVEAVKIVSASRNLIILSLVASKIFLLDALLRIDVLVIKRPPIKKRSKLGEMRSIHSSILSCDPPVIVVTFSTSSQKMMLYNPLNIDFFWFRCPEFLMDEIEQKSSRTTLMTDLLSCDDGGRNRDLLYVESPGEARGSTNLVRYASARKRRLQSTFEGSSSNYLSPQIRSSASLFVIHEGLSVSNASVELESKIEFSPDIQNNPTIPLPVIVVTPETESTSVQENTLSRSSNRNSAETEAAELVNYIITTATLGLQTK